jgi:hypothetical protein
MTIFSLTVVGLMSLLHLLSAFSAHLHSSESVVRLLSQEDGQRAVSGPR